MKILLLLCYAWRAVTVAKISHAVVQNIPRLFALAVRCENLSVEGELCTVQAPPPTANRMIGDVIMHRYSRARRTRGN